MIDNLFDNVTSLEDLLVVIANNEERISSNMKSLEDTTRLLSLILQRHSIQFWTEAYYEPSNPWHEMICAMPFFPDAKGLPELWERTKKWVKDKLVPVVTEIIEAVCAVVSFAVSDYWVFQNTYLGFSFAMGNPIVGGISAAVLSAVGSAVGGACGYMGVGCIFGK